MNLLPPLQAVVFLSELGIRRQPLLQSAEIQPGAREGLKREELGLGLPRGAHPFSQCPQGLLGQTTGILSW